MAAEEYNKLGVKLKFEMEMPNEDDFADNLEAQILEIQNKCNYFAPQNIVEQIRRKNCRHYHNKKKLENVNVINEDEDEPLLSSSVNSDNLEHKEISSPTDNEKESSEDSKSENDTVLNVGNNGMIHEV